MSRVCRAASLLALAALFAAGCGGTPGPAPSELFGGRVIDQDGAPVADAEICWSEGQGPGACGVSDADGQFSLPAPARDRFHVVAKGFHARQLSADALDAPIVLGRAPVLFVLLTDAITGEPLEQGAVRVAYPSGRQFGPFPVNRAGVRVRRVLPVGDAILWPDAAGYGPVDPVSVTLEPGKETAATIPMPPAD